MSRRRRNPKAFDTNPSLSTHWRRSSNGVFVPGGGGGGGDSAWVANAIAKGATHVYVYKSQGDDSDDRTSNGYDTTPPGGDYSSSVTAGGPLGNFIDMTGFSDAWDRTEGTDDLNPNIYSVEIIFRQPATAANVVLAANDSGSGSTRPWIVQLAASDGDLQAYGNNQAGPVITSEGSALDDDAWHHVIFTHSWTDGHVNHYIDGTQTVTDGSGSTSKQTNTNMSIGSRGPATLVGAFDIQAFAYYSGVELTPSQASSLYGDSGV